MLSLITDNISKQESSKRAKILYQLKTRITQGYWKFCLYYCFQNLPNLSFHPPWYQIKFNINRQPSNKKSPKQKEPAHCHQKFLWHQKAPNNVPPVLTLLQLLFLLKMNNKILIIDYVILIPSLFFLHTPTGPHLALPSSVWFVFVSVATRAAAHDFFQTIVDPQPPTTGARTSLRRSGVRRPEWRFIERGRAQLLIRSEGSGHFLTWELIEATPPSPSGSAVVCVRN